VNYQDYNREAQSAKPLSSGIIVEENTNPTEEQLSQFFAAYLCYIANINWSIEP
jgi:hypothetical protein